jgi:hypothetical protein
MMIDQTSYLGMPLRTLRERRRLVVLYYLLISMLGGVALWLGVGSTQISPLLWVAIGLGGLFGGIRLSGKSMDGPVKDYEKPPLPLGKEAGTQTLNLSGRKEFDRWEPLDERERTERDRAHYEAYRVLRWVLCCSYVAYWLGMNLADKWFKSRSLILFWIGLVVVLSLPQSVVMWTEPQEPAEELAEVRSGTR